MLSIVGNDLYLPKGDTGNLRINISSAYNTTNADRILFTIKKKNTPIIIRVLTPVNNQAILEFTNSMTDDLPAGKYRYDIRFIRDAELDSDGLPIDGEGVDTPHREAVFNLLETVGDV